MREKAFPIFITLLGVVTLYTFYMVWQSPTTQSMISPSSDTKTNHTPIQTAADTVSIDPEPLPLHNHIAKRIPTQKIQSQEYNVEQTQAQTQEVYDALLPEEYEEVLAQAQEGFTAIEAYADTAASQLLKEKAIQDEVFQKATP